jgi:glycyl-tRNA synthetase beta chain
MPELFIEILSEEIPARMQGRAREEFVRLMSDKLAKRGLSFKNPQAFSTPRRLCFIAEDIPLKQEDQTEEKKGPRIDAPQEAIEGFLKSLSISLSDCKQKETPKGTFLFADVHQKGVETVKLLPSLIEEVIQDFPWPKTMVWGEGQKTWVRPLQSGICIFNEKPLQFTISLGNEDSTEVPALVFSDETVGHRFLAPSAFSVKNYGDYKDKLRLSNVILSSDERKQIILSKMEEILKNHSQKLTLRMDEDLLEEVIGLVEWPVVYLGSIDTAFMDLPPEVLTTVMRVHQRYFSLETLDGKLAPYFFVVANTEALDKGQLIIKGNERVLRARLSDAKFFIEQDLKISLDANGKKLKDIIFHIKLGTMAQKTERLCALSQWLAPFFKVSEQDAKTAAYIAKADLTSDMVREFPELQGIMGRYYALKEGHSETIAHAIAGHYSPKGSEDKCPSDSLSQVVSLADRLDTLVGFFAIGIKPTGSKDPFALRRACLGIIRLLETNLDLKLSDLFEKSYNLYKDIFASNKEIRSFEETKKMLEEFFLDRLKVYWRDKGMRHDYIASAFAVGFDEPLGILYKRVSALKDFLEGKDQEGANLLSAYRRATNIVRIEEKKDKKTYIAKVDPKLLTLHEETTLYKALEESESEINQALASYDFIKIMKKLAQLRPAVDQYFDKVTVNAPEAQVRENRLSTLALIRATLGRVVDFSKIEDTH